MFLGFTQLKQLNQIGRTAMTRPLNGSRQCPASPPAHQMSFFKVVYRTMGEGIFPSPICALPTPILVRLTFLSKSVGSGQ